MKKRIEMDATFCDACDKQEYVTACMKCGTEHCYDCRKVKGVEYGHAVYFRGSGDGYYCTPCDQRLSESKDNPRHLAYQAIRALRDESAAWSEDFKLRSDIAEAEVKKYAEASDAQ